jgi:hypothetical protein
MNLIKIQFTLGLECEAYQVLDENMCVVGFINLDGSELILPEVTESKVVTGEVLDSSSLLLPNLVIPEVIVPEVITEQIIDII